jgi:hypothetical protein
MTFEQLQERGFDLTKADYMRGQRDVVRAYRDALTAARKRIRGLYDKLQGVSPENYFNEAVKFRRLQTLETQLIAAYRDAARAAGTTIEASAKVAISNSYYRQQYANILGSSLIEAKITVPVLSTEVIETSVYGTQALWQNRFGRAADYAPKSGALLKAILDKNRTADVDRVRRAITQSITLGEPYTKAAGRVKNILDSSASDAVRIMRTEGHRNATSGQYAAKQSAAADGVPTRRQIVSVLDDRTRPQSAIVDGQVEDEDGFFTYPGGVLVKIPGNSGRGEWDINDRESVIMVIDGVEPTARRARNPVTGKNEIISWQGFDDWAKSEGLTRNRYGQIMEE